MATVIGPARLLTLGRLALLDGAGRDLIPAETTKLLGLLAFLTAAPGRRATREQLIDLFWDDRSIVLARGSLRQALHRLRDTLGEDHLPAGNGDVLLTRALQCDRDEFLAAIAAGTLDEALERYGGAFAPGFLARGSSAFEQWRDQERERLHQLYAAAAESVAQRALDAGEPKRASTIALRLLSDQPLNEHAWRLRLQAEQAAGSHVHLVASIAELRRLLASEGWQPEARTVQLLQSLERPLDTPVGDPDAARLMTDLVGRAPALAKLHDAWREATHRHGVHLHLTGASGLGKSRVMDDFAVRLRAEKVRVAKARALPRQRAVPSAMLASVISALVELPGATGISEHSARVLVGLQPAISTRFPTAVPFDYTQLDTRFVARLEALDDLVGAVSHDGPVCLLLDDVHWWDETSRRTIEHVIERLAGRPVLVVTASRPGPGEIHTECTREKLFLAPLLRDDVVLLLQSLGDHADAKAVERLADGVQKAAAGVPLLVLEAIRLGLDRGLLGLTEQRWDLDRLDDFLAILHPGRLLNERLATLTGPQTHVLLVAWLAEFPLTADDMISIDGGADSSTLIDLERLGFLAATHAGLVITHDSIGEAVEAGASLEAIRRARCAAGLLTRERGDGTILLGQAAKLFFEADAQSELLDTASLWLRQRRAEQSTAPAADLLWELLGQDADKPMVRGLLKRLPRDLRRAPWTAMRLAPIWAVAGAIIMGTGWWLSTRQPPPDAILGVLEQGSDGTVTETQIALRQSAWASSDYKLLVNKPRRLTKWGAVFDSVNIAPLRDPMRDRWVWSRALRPDTDPNGPTDLKLREFGVTHVLAPAAGDDVAPSWSPDGRYVAIGTTRWSPRKNADFDIGIVEVATGEVRQITRGPDADLVPFWSPDGTRIGFLRRSEQLAPDSLCWVTMNGRKQHCRGVAGGQVDGIIGWTDNHTLAILTRAEGGTPRIEFDDIDGGADQVPEISSQGGLRISPDGVWLAQLEQRQSGSEAGAVLSVMQTANPGLRRSIVLHSGAGRNAYVYFDQPPANRGLVALTILRSRDTITAAAKAPFRLTVEGVSARGTVMPVISGVLTWSSSDSTVATVSDSGDVRGVRPGRVTITASAGGWRQASAHLVVREESAPLVWEERWQRDWPGRWMAWGTPLPRLIYHADGSNTMLPNGDGEYSSGLVSKQRFDGRNGLALDVDVSTPITRPKWQFVHLFVNTPAAPSYSGPGGVGCSLRYPNGEGWISHTVIVGMPMDSALANGKWYHLRVQYFPDGSCGYALNGRALLHSAVVSTLSDSMVIALGGQTVGSQLVFGRVQVRSGVPTDVDWGRIEKQAIKPHD